MPHTTIVFDDQDLSLLEGWLEDQAIFHYPVPETIDEEVIKEIRDGIESGRTALPIDVLAQHDPPLAWMLMKIYDSTGWPNAFDADQKAFTSKMIAEAMGELRQQQRELSGTEEE